MGDPLLDLALVASEFAVRTDNALDPELLRAFLASWVRDAVRPVRFTADDFYAALLFVYCKFACYTLPLQGGPTAYAGGNEYRDRLRRALSSSGRQQILRWVGDHTTVDPHLC